MFTLHLIPLVAAEGATKEGHILSQQRHNNPRPFSYRHSIPAPRSCPQKNTRTVKNRDAQMHAGGARSSLWSSSSSFSQAPLGMLTFCRRLLLAAAILKQKREPPPWQGRGGKRTWKGRARAPVRIGCRSATRRPGGALRKSLTNLDLPAWRRLQGRDSRMRRRLERGGAGRQPGSRREGACAALGNGMEGGGALLLASRSPLCGKIKSPPPLLLLLKPSKIQPEKLFSAS